LLFLFLFIFRYTFFKIGPYREFWFGGEAIDGYVLCIFSKAIDGAGHDWWMIGLAVIYFFKG